MLIIFDLDDTLLETSRDITPKKLKLAFDRMIAEGLVVDDNEKAFERLIAINQQEESASKAIKKFLDELRPTVKDFFHLACNVVYGPIPKDWTIDTVPGAKVVLKNLIQQSHVLICVSRGVEEIQLNKLKKAGIDISMFYKIIVSDQNKLVHYQNIVDEFKIDPKQVIVCGDRVKRDLLGAKELGFWTILMLRGRGMIENRDQKEVDFIAHDLYEVENIISAQLQKEKE